MDNIQTAEIIKLELKKNKKTITNMIEDLNLTKSFIQNLTQRGSKPSIETMEHIAEYLGVSIDYLVGRKENKPSIENSNIANVGGTNTININKSENVSYLEMELIQEIKKLSKAEQIKLLEQLNKE